MTPQQARALGAAIGDALNAAASVAESGGSNSVDVGDVLRSVALARALDDVSRDELQAAIARAS